MRSLLTPLFSNFMVSDVITHFGSESNTFVTVGRKVGTGANTSNVEDAVWTTNDRNQFYRNMIGVKKIAPSDMQPVVARVDWVADKLYDSYEDHIQIYSYLDNVNLGTANANANTVLAGTANINASNVVIGNGTSFLAYVFPGDQIRVNSATRSVVTVTNNQHLVVNSAFANTNTDATITLLHNARIIVANTANFVGNVDLGNVVVVSDATKEVVAIKSNKVLVVNTALTISVSNAAISRQDNTYPYTANNFYVRNSRDQVFKCLFNANGSVSTIEPTIDIDGQLPENAFILTADGYKWKYLYTIPPGLKQKFFTNKWMPVVTDPAVVSTSVDGRIDIVRILWGGSGYLGGGNSNIAPILQVTKTDGQGANLVARVANGNIGSVTILTGGNNYTEGVIAIVNGEQLGPVTLGGTVNVSGTTLIANTSNTSNQSFLGNVFINDIITVNAQTRNVVSVINSTHLTVNTAFSNSNTQIAEIIRSNAVFDIQIGFPGGHGSDPVKELRSQSVMISVELNGTENSTIPISDNTNLFDFNQVGLLMDPLVANGAYTANATNYRATTRLLVSAAGIINFVDDETVYVGDSLESATGVANVAHWDTSTNYLYINNITGSFATLQTIRGVSSGLNLPILNISTAQNIRLFTGDLIYMENRSNVTRKDDQIDQVKIVLSF
jgi:hypothetical protein